MNAPATEPVMYLLVNGEVAMTPGKIGAQVAHAAVLVVLRALIEHDTHVHYHGPRIQADRPGVLQDWLAASFKKIVLKADADLLLRLEEEGFVAVRDAGHTEVAPNTLTVVGMPLMKRGDAPDWLRALRVYR